MYKMKQKSVTPEPKLKEAYEIGKNAGLKHVYIGNISLICLENTYCSNCNELLVERVRYEIKENKIKNNACPKCKTRIHGIWES